TRRFLSGLSRSRRTLASCSFFRKLAARHAGSKSDARLHRLPLADRESQNVRQLPRRQCRRREVCEARMVCRGPSAAAELRIGQLSRTNATTLEVAPRKRTLQIPRRTFHRRRAAAARSTTVA